ncbi:prickle-like protein 4 isoform X1 [Microcaecilia unicolor]|uniref:Prickle-like protein 4 isoform X1 n=1 Tax=Microcaecilia unicolor TaxID=1415580 RepID=A0A6P7ZVR4_9AMPH|nr:prickle-like protein 4 isoform X1 [Microcaecilia unicolor]XP_030077360.1 prickle-like protein 4 isoform X1 [Microcaecilia unicolor]
MAVLSPVHYQRARFTCNGKQAGTSDASPCDNDSGCVLEEELQPAKLFNSPRTDIITAVHLKALLSQLPPQDSDDRYCHWFLGEKERGELQRFSAWRRLNALGQAVLQPTVSLSAECCSPQCGRQMNRGEMAVWASKLGDHCCWHPSCFTCVTCSQPLLHLIYFHQDGDVYCGRHHAELFRPRCASCDQLIFAEELTEAEGWNWHVEHFCCTDCEGVLGGQKYVMKSGSPYCFTCFQSLYAETCQSCGDPIGLDCQHVSYQGQHWHARTSCFCCDSCQKSLLGSPFTIRYGVLFCSETCSWNPDFVSHGIGDGTTQRDSSETVEAWWNQTGQTASHRVHDNAPQFQGKDPQDPKAVWPQPKEDRVTRPSQKDVQSSNCEKQPIETLMAAGHITTRDSTGTSVATQKAPSEPPVVSLQRHRSAQDSKTRGELSLSRQEPDWESEPCALYGPSCSALITQHQGPQPERKKQSCQALHQHNGGESGLKNQTLSGRASCSACPGNSQRAAGDDHSGCSTCSSSSESEQEGFFFGKPIPSCRTTDSICAGQDWNPHREDERNKKCNVS